VQPSPGIDIAEIAGVVEFVRRQRTKASAVRYPVIKCCARIMTSPSSPAAAGSPSSPRMTISTPAAGQPTQASSPPDAYQASVSSASSTVMGLNTSLLP